LEIGNAYYAEGNYPAARVEFDRVVKMEGAKENNKKDAQLSLQKIDGQLKSPVRPVDESSKKR